MKFVINLYSPAETRRDGGPPGDIQNSYKRLQKFLTDKYPEDDFHFHNIDIDGAENLTDYGDNLIEQIDGGDLEWPLIVINDEIAGNGTVSTAQISKWFEERR